VVSAGPLLLSGPVEISGTTGPPQVGSKAALCRCGASRAKPYCDGSHRRVGFESGPPRIGESE
jgi:CDGSH-type Zn-finger protein